MKAERHSCSRDTAQQRRSPTRFSLCRAHVAALGGEEYILDPTVRTAKESTCAAPLGAVAQYLEHHVLQMRYPEFVGAGPSPRH